MKATIMEWGGLLLQTIMLGVFLLREGYIKQKGKNLADKDDMREILFESEKGKNLATKEDIKDITQKVEEVKNTFNKDLARFNANLSLLNNLQTGIFMEERNAILEFNKNFFIWQKSTLTFEHSDFTNNNDLKEYNSKVDKYYEQASRSMILFEFFIEDKELILKAKKLILKTLELNKGIPLITSKLSAINREIEALQETCSPYHDELSKVSSLISEFFNIQNKTLGDIKPYNIEFQQHCREYIYNRLKIKTNSVD